MNFKTFKHCKISQKIFRISKFNLAYNLFQEILQKNLYFF